MGDSEDRNAVGGQAGETEDFRGQQAGLQHKIHHQEKKPILSFINLLLAEWVVSAQFWVPV